MTQRPQNCVEHQVQLLAHVFSKEPQHQVAALLQQLILAPVAAVRDRIREMLRAIQFHRHTGIGAHEIDFESSLIRQRNLEAGHTTPGGWRGRQD